MIKIIITALFSFVITLAIIFLSLYVRYRLPALSGRIVVEWPVHYKMLVFATEDNVRYLFESQLRGKKLLSLQNGQAFWLSAEDGDKLWPEAPVVMSEKGYTIKAKISAQPLYFGGYAYAKLLSFEKVEGQPYITK